MTGLAGVKTNNYREAYRLLYDHFGPQNWWPGDTPFEIMVGAILTQNTSWSNVQKAIDNLKTEDLLTYQSLSRLTVDEIAQMIRPAGYYNLKAQRLRNLFDMVATIYDGDLELDSLNLDYIENEINPILILINGNFKVLNNIVNENTDNSII